MKLSILLTPILGLALVGATLYSPHADAHRVWIKPNTTVVSGEASWITFDAAIANGIFTADHHAYPLDRVVAKGPDGKAIELQNTAILQYRSVFDLHLQQQGTYKVETASQSLLARWEDKNGERKFWPARGKIATIEDFNAEVPKDAKNLEVSETYRRLETFVTLGAPTETVLAISGKGLELQAISHPNDLYVDENVEFQIMMAGKPAANADITLVRQDEQYRDTETEVKLNSDAQGKVTYTFTEPGMYWLEAEYSDNKATAPATQRRASYIGVFEVLPM